jgi:acetoin utilization deacetylase AcuC-like enzyme
MTKQLQLNFYWTINSKDSNYRFRCTQGNGTAEIFTKTLMCLPFQHMVELIPFKKETSDLDIDDNTSDDEFLKIISTVIPKLIEAQNPISFLFSWR